MALLRSMIQLGLGLRFAVSSISAACLCAPRCAQQERYHVIRTLPLEAKARGII